MRASIQEGVCVCMYKRVCVCISMTFYLNIYRMITGNYLTTRGEDAARYLTAAVVVSIPWNMVVGVSSMERPLCNLLLNHYLAKCLCQLATSLSYKLAGNHKWDLDHVVKVWSTCVPVALE